MEDVLSDPSVQAVFVATRHDLHAEQGLSVLRAGKALFLEKPLSISPEQQAAFEEGIAALGPSCPPWMLGFNRRFAPAARVVREFMAAVPGPKTLSYRLNAGPIPADHWTQDPEVGGGRILGEACHAIDLSSFLVGSPVVRVHAEAVAPGGAAGSGEDQAFLLLRFADGSVASVGYLAGGDKSFPKERIEVFGGGRIAVLDDFHSVTTVAGGKARTRKMDRDKGHAAEVAAFVEAVQKGEPAPVPAAASLNASRAALACMESLRTGVPVAVER
jgi:predicted dehydrogenase